MNGTAFTYVVNNIALPIHASHEEAFSVASAKLGSAGIRHDRETFYIYRRSIDARRRSDIRFVYSVAVLSENPPKHVEKLKALSIVPIEYVEPQPILGEKRIEHPIAVVGSGPAGLFSALMLAESGFPVLMLERGGDVSERTRAVSDFIRTRRLDPNTNIQFGAGGAGTFSDGKLVTRINDSMSTYVLKRLVEFGAPSDIMYMAKPHVGTDVLSVVVENIIKHIRSLGATVLFHTTVTDFVTSGNAVTALATTKGDFPCSGVILAIGHSARDTYMKIIERGMHVEAKDFSIGMRIEHSRIAINRGLYGDLADDPALPVGEYNLSYNTKVRGVYTFCMCPGGEVVAAASEEGGVVVNGMSYHSRSGDNSNSAVCCSIFKSDYGATPEKAIAFQRSVERAAYVAGGKDYSAPMITVGDFLRGVCITSPSTIKPTYMGGNGTRLARPEEYLPAFVCDSIRAAILDFDKKIPGFASPNALLTGPETRTSAPIRIKRDAETRLAIGYSNLYPCGEGAGYAGGITSAAIDGIKCTMSLMKNYRP